MREEALALELEDKKKILVVDDDEIIRSLFVDTLREFGYRCETARDGLECIRRVSNGHDYDLILLDVKMPRLNGLETLKKLRVHSPDTSIIIVSASKEIEDVRIALKEGAYDYIFKPFKVMDLETQITRAVERTRLIKENKDYQKNLEKKVSEQTQDILNLYSDTLEALVLALDLREHETGYHSYRVTEYALTLAKRVGLPDSDLSVIAKGALLHDIGKIGVPDSILLKPDKLDWEEWEVMRKHPAMGYELLKKIGFLEEAANIVFSHHEHYDGNGYPQGLSGDAIPIGARVFAVVDALDAITSNRIYNKGIPFDQAIDRIAGKSGTQFDPEVIKFFLAISEEEWLKMRNRIESTDTAYLRKLLYRLIRK